MPKLFRFFLCAVFCATLAGCATSPSDKYNGMPAESLYAIGHNAVTKGNFNTAVTALQSLNAQYPFEKFSQQASLDLIYAQYETGNPELALAEAARFLRLYPQSPHADYAYYMMGVIDFNNGRGFIQRRFPYNMSEHDAANYRNAYESFMTVLNKYPHSRYAQDARRRAIFLRNTLAQFEINVAQFYFERETYLAAIDRAKVVYDHYPNSPQVKEAMQIMIKSYKALKLPKLADTLQKVYNYNFAPQATSSAPEKIEAKAKPKTTAQPKMTSAS